MGIFDKIIGKKSAQGGPASGWEKPAEKKEKPKKDRVQAKQVKAEKKPKKPVVTQPRKKEKTRKVLKKERNIAHQILIEPFITEKSTSLGQFNKYVFKVSHEAGKNRIKEAIQDYYGVGVTSVNIIKIHPKKRIHGRTVGWKQGFKKAIVTLQEGDTIGITEGV